MEVKENDIEKDSILYPTQNENLVNDDQYSNLIIKQAKEFENFGKQMSLNLQNFRKEFLIQQNEIINEPFDIEKVFNNYKEKIDSQLKLIDSLKNRIEELETNSFIKSQDIKKLQNDLKDFKESATPVATLATHENDINLKIPELNFQLIDEEEEKSNCSKSIDDDFSISNQQDSEDYYDQQYDEDNYDKETSTSYRQYDEDNYDKETSTSYRQYGEDYYDDETSTSYQQYDEDNYDKETSTSYQQYEEDYYDDETSTSYQQYDEDYYDEKYENESYQRFIESDPGITYFDFIQFERDFILSTNEQQKPSIQRPSTQQKSQQKPFTSLTSSQSYISNSNVPVHEDILMMIHAKAQEIINEKKNGRRRINRKLNNHTFTPLCDFGMNNLLKYEKSYLFQSLSNRVKGRIRASIVAELKDEFFNSKKKLTQPIKVYAEKKIIPPLPPGINSYTDYQKSYRYNNSSNKTKWRIQKIISLENNE
jgi:hypothetical protein